MSDSARVKRVFDEAADLPPAERSAFLDRACGGDAALRARVLDLLEAIERSEAFLAEPTAPGVPPGADDRPDRAALEGPGTRIGPYRLLDLIGEGGFGAVYLAEQREPVERKVALKIIKAGMDTRQVIARFEAERQALAMMDHPGIARVFDAGATAAGRPYFVMELVAGEPITAYCDKHNLPVRERLDLFVQVCRAVQHAHTKGVIHRDLKPSNVLVYAQDGEPHAKVIDFGIAKATARRLTEKTLFTQLRQLVGTPAYMSPEQAEASLDIDTRADVYSLGVLLYELLTGVTPFDPERLRSAAWAEMERMIREEEPAKPSTRLSTLEALPSVAANRRTEPARLTRLVRGDLDWVVMKCLEKDRRRRYESANDLAGDVQRHLAGEAVVAAPPGTGYRLRKAVRRHRRAVLLGGTVAGALLAGSAMATAGLVRATANARHARQEAARADTVSRFLQEMLESADPALAEGRGLSIGFVLGQAVKRVDDGAFADQPQTEASLREAIGRTYTRLLLFPAAEVQLAKAIDIRTRVLGSEHPDTLTAVYHWGIAVQQYNDRFAELEPVVRRNLEARTRVLGERHPDTLDAMDKVAWALACQGKAEAESISRRVLELRESVHGSLHPKTIESLRYMGNTLSWTGRFAEAETYYREHLHRSTNVYGAESPEAADSNSILAANLHRQGRTAEAEPFARRAVEIDRGASFPSRLSEHLACLAPVVGDLGRPEECSRMLEEAVDIKRRLRGPDDQDTLCTMHIAAKIYRDQGDQAKAEAMFQEVVEARRRVKQPDQIIWTLAAMWDLAGLYESQHRYDAAEPLLLGAHEEANAEPRTATADKRTAVERLVGLYEAWDRAEPDRGYDTKWGQWREALDRAPANAP